jgi:hypothetical protein
VALRVVIPVQKLPEAAAIAGAYPPALIPKEEAVVVEVM